MSLTLNLLTSQNFLLKGVSDVAYPLFTKLYSFLYSFLLVAAQQQLHSRTKRQKRPYTFITRIHHFPQAKHIPIIVDRAYLNSIQCSLHCLNNVPLEDVASVRSEYLSKNQLERNLWITSYLHNNLVTQGISSSTRWHIRGHDVCKYCWLLATSVTPHKLQHHFRTTHSLSGVLHTTPRTSAAIVWLTNFFDSVCDKMPTSGEYHLPPYLQWSDILQDLNTFLQTNGHRSFSDNYFSRLHSNCFPKVKLPASTRQGKCDVCLQLKESRKNATTEQERLRFQEELRVHNEAQMKERQLYYARCLQAKQQPDQYMSLIMDGMNTPSFPLHVPLPKGTSRIDRLKLHVLGFIDHGNSSYHMYGSLDHWPHGANYVTSILWTYLQQRMKTSIEEGSEWPHTLYLQIDNCWRENKNTTLFGFLALLIKHGWFREIHVNSLPTGHTHEDIDRMYSSWNIHYWKKGLQSPASIPDFLVWAYPDPTFRPQWHTVHSCFDIKEMLKYSIVKMSGHSQARAFKFLPNDNNVAMWYKSSSLDNTWFGLTTDPSKGILLFNDVIPSDIMPKRMTLSALNNDIIESLLTNTSITHYFTLDDMLFFSQLRHGMFVEISFIFQITFFTLNQYTVVNFFNMDHFKMRMM